MQIALLMEQGLKKEISLNNMVSRGIRGATTISADTKEEIKSATVELLNEIIKQNEIKTEDISFAIFTVTKDIRSDFPAKYARLYAGFKYVPMMNYLEADIKGSIEKCIRVMLNVNTDKKQNEIKHIYLKDAKNLRQDLQNDQNS